MAEHLFLYIFLVQEITGFSLFSITISYKRQDVTFGLFTTISGMEVVGTLHSLSYDILSPDMLRPVYIEY